MKPVIAFGQDTDFLVLLELRQAHGAFHHVGVGLGRVEEDGEGSQEGGVEAARGGGGVGLFGVEDQGGAAAAAAAAAELELARAVEVPAGVDVEADHEDHHGEQHHDCG